MKRLADDLVLKTQLLSRYLWPGLGLDYAPEHPVTMGFAQASKRYEVTKYEHFELAGPFEAGQAYLFEHALSHSYFHYADTGEDQGACIHRPHELIFQGDSLLHGEYRSASLQALEPGGLLAVPYPTLRQLMRRHEMLNTAIESLSREHERALNELGRFLGMPTEQRFRLFREKHRSLLLRLPQHVQAMHIKVSATQFKRCLKKEQKSLGGNNH